MPYRSTVAACALALSACTGLIHASDEAAAPGPTSDGSDPPLEAPDCDPVGPRLLRRLTATQLRNTLVDVFEDEAVPDAIVLTDPVILGFKVDATQAVVRDLTAQQIMNHAEKVAAWAATTKLDSVSPCQQFDAACAAQFVRAFGSRVYRGEVPEPSVDAYVAMFLAEEAFAPGVEAVVGAMLQSPHFLYRRELGRERDGRYALTAEQLAENLAYTLTDRPPDATLRAAAASGDLDTPSGLTREFERLVADERSTPTLAAFVRQWLEFDDLLTVAKVDPQGRLSPDVRASMMRETEAFFADAVRSDLTIAELFTARHTFVDGRLASLYQLGGGGDGLVRTELQPGTRAGGLLGQGSVLMRHALADVSSPVQRGVLVRERLLCQELTPPPPEVNANLSPATVGATTRERYLQHSQDAACAGCHALTDPVGFAFEQFDAFGLRRSEDQGRPIDATGQLSGVEGGPVDLDGLDSLSAYLATSREVRECVGRYASYFAYGLDGCGADERAELTQRADLTTRELLRGIVLAAHFHERRE